MRKIRSGRPSVPREKAAAMSKERLQGIIESVNLGGVKAMVDGRKIALFVPGSTKKRMFDPSGMTLDEAVKALREKALLLEVMDS